MMEESNLIVSSSAQVRREWPAARGDSHSFPVSPRGRPTAQNPISQHQLVLQAQGGWH